MAHFLKKFLDRSLMSGQGHPATKGKNKKVVLTNMSITPISNYVEDDKGTLLIKGDEENRSELTDLPVFKDKGCVLDKMTVDKGPIATYIKKKVF